MNVCMRGFQLNRALVNFGQASVHCRFPQVCQGSAAPRPPASTTCRTPQAPERAFWAPALSLP